MPIPVLTPEEIAALKRQKAVEQNYIETTQVAIPAKQAQIAFYATVDGSFKKFFDYYNDNIIAQYDAEYVALNGRYIADPISEADVYGPASMDGSWRTTPALPQTDIVRIPEFDGGGTSTEQENEERWIADQADVEDRLVNGYSPSGGFDESSAQTDSVLSAGSTTLDVIDNTNPLTIAIGAYFVVSGGGNFAVVQVTSVTDNMGGDPPYEFTYGITVILPPVAPISAGASLSEFTGFTNGERAAKTASNPNLQGIMDKLVADLQFAVNRRILRLAAQTVALNANEDPDAVSEIAATLLDVDASSDFLTNYLITTDISDTGLGLLSAERATRGAQITARIAQINANYTGQTENYYDRRYSIANDRGNTARGSLRLQINCSQVASNMQGYIDTAQDSIDAIDALLP